MNRLSKFTLVIFLVPLCSIIFLSKLKAAALSCNISPEVLPYPAGSSYYVAQDRQNIGGSHAPDDYSNQWAWDFGMYRQNVVATQKGTIIAIKFNNDDQDEDANTALPGNCATLANYISIKHLDGTSSMYLHLLKDSGVVSVGDKVEQGDILALSGNSGCSQGSHLHYTLQDNTNDVTGYGRSIKSEFGDNSACNATYLGNPQVYNPATAVHETFLSDNKKNLVSVVSPGRNDEISHLDTTLTFQWNKYRDATIYELQVLNPAGGTNFHDFFTNTGVLSTTMSLSNVPLSTEITWKLRAYEKDRSDLDNDGNTTENAWTDYTVRKFKIVAKPPTITSPLNTALVNSNNLLVKIQDPKPGRAFQYKYQIDDNIDFSSPLVDTDLIDSREVPFRLNKSTDYYLRTKLKDVALNLESEYSSSIGFKIRFTAPKADIVDDKLIQSITHLNTLVGSRIMNTTNYSWDYDEFSGSSMTEVGTASFGTNLMQSTLGTDGYIRTRFITKTGTLFNQSNWDPALVGWNKSGTSRFKPDVIKVSDGIIQTSVGGDSILRSRKFNFDGTLAYDWQQNGNGYSEIATFKLSNGTFIQAVTDANFSVRTRLLGANGAVIRDLGFTNPSGSSIPTPIFSEVSGKIYQSTLGKDSGLRIRVFNLAGDVVKDWYKPLNTLSSANFFEANGNTYAAFIGTDLKLQIKKLNATTYDFESTSFSSPTITFKNISSVTKIGSNVLIVGIATDGNVVKGIVNSSLGVVQSFATDGKSNFDVSAVISGNYYVIATGGDDNIVRSKKLNLTTLSWDTDWERPIMAIKKVALSGFGSKIMQVTSGQNNLVETRIFDKDTSVWNYIDTSGSTPWAPLATTNGSNFLEATLGTDRYVRFRGVEADGSAGAWQKINLTTNFKPELAGTTNSYAVGVIADSGALTTKFINSSDFSFINSSNEVSGSSVLPVAIAGNDGKFYIATVASDNFIRTRVVSADGGTIVTDWVKNGSASTKVSMFASLGRVYQFAPGTDGLLRYRYFPDSTTNDWTAWIKSGASVKPASIGFDSAGRIFVATIDSTNVVRVRILDKDLNVVKDWENIGATKANTEFTTLSNSVYQTIWDVSNKQYYRKYDPTTNTWSGWNDAGSALTEVSVFGLENVINFASGGINNYLRSTNVVE